MRAPEQVGRTAGLMLDRDFGLAGTAELVAGRTDLAKVTIRGAGLGPVGGLVQVGDVFALAAVRKTNRPAPPPVAARRARSSPRRRVPSPRPA